MEPSGNAVKIPKEGLNGRPRQRDIARYFDGWELGAIVVGLVLATALLAVPRGAAPVVFPVPLVDVAEAAGARRHFDELADRAEREGLPFETRAVGDAVRRLGLLLSGEPGDGEHLGRLLAERVQTALAAGQLEQLEQLRAVQARFFVRAVRQHSFEGAVPAELAALGGDFAARAKRNGWAGPAGCVADDDELRTLFARRWVELTRLREHARFKSSLAEVRRYYRFLLLHPERTSGSSEVSRERASMRLRYVDALSQRDTEYPVALARGCLFGELGSAPESAAALSDYLARPSSGEWILRARNYLVFAANSASDER